MDGFATVHWMLKKIVQIVLQCHMVKSAMTRLQAFCVEDLKACKKVNKRLPPALMENRFSL